MEKRIRRYDLDWLRVIVFALLIFYHVGMFFVPWGWHIKNERIYDDLIWPMLFLNQWRLPILFTISGMGTYYALSKRNLRQFSWERVGRLGVPLLFGMLLIVPPQIYIERLVDGDFTGTYMEYYRTMAFRNGTYPQGDISWHHLWFLPYLLLFSLLLGPLFLRLKRRPSKLVGWTQRQLDKTFGFYWFIIPLFFVEAFVEPFFPTTHALIGDWFTLAFYGLLFFYGFLLLCTGPTFWTALDKVKSKALWVGILAFTLLICRWLFVEKDELPQHLGEAFLKVTNLWSWILVIFAYGAQYLNKPSKHLAYANRAVYPFYILHQTITVILAYYVYDKDWGLLVKGTILVIGTFGISWLIYHFIILRIRFLHPFFGLKGKKA
ncbi:acyltransferase family protein [Flagellimonas sp. DF-77]|uniref:acyltransferase family protein n=1 Tax=Flagellimonas algarum TaxID=3230298 RepID=UPI00339248CD